jgi:hypothetical protein
MQDLWTCGMGSDVMQEDLEGVALLFYYVGKCDFPA